MSCWPEAVPPAFEAASDVRIPPGAYANGFCRIPQDFKRRTATVDILETRTDLTPDVYVDFPRRWVKLGVTTSGGCCEVGPTHIARLSPWLTPGATVVDREATRA